MTSHPADGPHIRLATERDGDSVGAIVAAAFEDDPITLWLVPDPELRRTLCSPIFRLYVQPYLAHGHTYLTDDGSATAVWLPPGAELMTPEAEAAMGESLAELVGDDIGRFMALDEAFARHHPDVPVYHLQFLATLPARQGRGIGAALLRDTLARADRDGVVSSLEATAPRNRALYERHGFVAQDECVLPEGGPPFWPMRRNPRRADR